MMRKRPLQRGFATLAEERIQALGHLLGRDVLDGVDAHGHALEDVHVEDVDGLQHVGQLAARAAKHQHVAHAIHAHHGTRRRQGLEDFLHLEGTDELQRHDPVAKSGHVATRSHRRTETFQQGTRPDPEMPVGRADQRGTVGDEKGIQHVQQVFARNRADGAERHRALQAGLQGKTVTKGVAEDGLDDLRQRSIVEVEADAFGVFLNRLGRRGLPRFDVDQRRIPGINLRPGPLVGGFQPGA